MPPGIKMHDGQMSEFGASPAFAPSLHLTGISHLIPDFPDSLDKPMLLTQNKAA
jgi:hypothetical protein